MSKIKNLKSEIMSALNGCIVKAKENGKWTEEVNKAICEVGTKNGFDVCAKNCCGNHDGEWLYDMVWLKYKENFLSKSIMVLECEWDINEDGIFHDFDKLLIARADLRVMIFERPNEKLAKNVFLNRDMTESCGRR